MIYLVHVGYHLVTTCLPRHWINGRGRDRRMNIGRRGCSGHISADRCEYVGREHVRRQHVPGANMYLVPTCTRRQHIPGANIYRAPTYTGRQHIPGANIYRAPTCTGRQHVGCQLKGANLTPFFSKNTPKTTISC
jgi:hypothetical protein